MSNIEMKCRFNDLNEARKISIRLGARHLWTDSQQDTYFTTSKGKLKLRESALNGAELLPYLKIKASNGGLKRSDYVRIPIHEPAATREILGQLLGESSTVRKIREVYLLDNIRIHLDSVERLGRFLEFEAVLSEPSPDAIQRETQKIRGLLSEFMLSEEDLLLQSYPELLQSHVFATNSLT